MARRSTKLLRFENSLYKYDKEKQNLAFEPREEAGEQWHDKTPW